MTKTLTWHIPGQQVAGAAQGPAFRLPTDCTILHVWANAGTAPSGSNLVFDINEDGTSLFPTTKPSLVKGNSRMDDRDIVYTSNYLAEGSVLTLDIDSVGNGEPGRDLTVQMDLEEISV